MITVVYSGANYNNANANNGLSYFNRNNVSNSYDIIGGRNFIKLLSILGISYPYHLVENIILAFNSLVGIYSEDYAKNKKIIALKCEQI